MKRRPILLLELLISLVIMGIILELLFSGYYQAISGKKELLLAKEMVLGRQRLLLRLGALFQAAESCREIRGGFFLQYHGGVDPDPHFRGPLEAFLFHKDGKLMLVSWSTTGVPRTEFLYEGVEKISLNFFDVKKGCFQSSFPESHPLMMKVSLEIKKQPPLELPLFL